jgi:hypothetical protein
LTLRAEIRHPLTGQRHRRCGSGDGGRQGAHAAMQLNDVRR